jgi:hypothetical protein
LLQFFHLDSEHSEFTYKGIGDSILELNLEIRMNVTGTFFTAGGFSFDGVAPASYAIFYGESNFGKISGEGVDQLTPTGRTGPLPDGTIGQELTLEGYYASTRFDLTGDLLLERGFPGSATAYADPLTGVIHREGVATIIGGTGHFKGATGTKQIVNDGQTEVATGSPPGSLGIIGFFLGTYIVDVTLPDASIDDLNYFRQFVGVLEPNSPSQITLEPIPSDSAPFLAAGVGSLIGEALTI